MILPDKLNTDSPVPTGSQKYITVFTDGSFCHITKAWGIGVWYRYDDNKPRKISMGGKGDFNNSNEVEAFGIHVALQEIRVLPVMEYTMVLQCDCIDALTKFSADIIQNDLGLKQVKFKHVKAHADNITKRTNINSLVDSLARRTMRKYR